MTPFELLSEVIRPTLKEFAKVDTRLHTSKAEALLLGTAIVESKLRNIRQMGRGPARSYFQIEPFTARDVLARSRSVFAPVLASLTLPAFDPIDQLAANQFLACGIARIKYWFDKAAIPGTARDLSYYHKRIYNTYLGAADPEKNIDEFSEALTLVAKQQ